MVGSVRSTGDREVMVVLPWLHVAVLILFSITISPTECRSALYGDIGADDVAIDNLNYDPPTREEFNNFFKNIPRKIPFAVAPRDPRFFMPRSFFLNRQMVDDNQVDAGSTGEQDEEFYRDNHEYQDTVYHDVVPADYGRGPHLVYDPYEAHGRQTHHMAMDPNLHYEDQGRMEDHGGGGDMEAVPGGFNGRFEDYMQDAPAIPGVREHQQEHDKPAPKLGSKSEFDPKNALPKPGSSDGKVNYLKQSKSNVQQPLNYVTEAHGSNVMSDFSFVALVSGCTAAAVCAVFGGGICYFRLHKNKRDAAAADYPAYGVTGPNKELSPGAADRKMAQSAHMFHYQHQKQQMIALEKSAGDDRHCSTSDVDSDEECEEGDYTVYECPGLAPTGEMEVKNPLFSDDPTPVTPQVKKEGGPRADSRKDSDDEDD